MMITFEEAVAIAQGVLDQEIWPGVGEDVAINMAATVETPDRWVFFYNTRAFLETGLIRHALAGNGPIIVERQDGRVRRAHAASPWEEQVES